MRFEGSVDENNEETYGGFECNNLKKKI